MLPHVYRITKHDPADRDQRGHYTGTEEVHSDHGPVEGAYLEAVAVFAAETGIDCLVVREPEVAAGFVGFGAESAVEGHGLGGLFPPGRAGYHDGAQVSLGVALELVRAMLRGSGGWCRLEVEGRFTIHVGWDQYVYVGSSDPCPVAVARTRALGLFPERLDASPYEAEVDGPGVQRPADDVFWARVRWCVATRQAALLEENHVGNAARWHRLEADSLDAVRARLAPRSRLAVWPDLSADVGAVLADLPEEGLIEFVWEDEDGRIASIVADESQFAELAAHVCGARAASALSLCIVGRQPLMTAVLPDEDGVLRARWRTEATSDDRNWAFLTTLHRGQICTGTVVAMPEFGVTFVDIGSFTAMINLPEVSWRHIDHPSDVLTVGQEVTAEILDVDLVRQRVPLSLKALEEDPLSVLAQQVGRIVRGPVTRLTPSGALVRIEDRDHGLEGLLHRTEPAEMSVDEPEEGIQVGDILTVEIIDVDPGNRRIKLSRVQARSADAQ
ncbi:S1 RNA-binding domain-containing protein [Streptomyces katrae]|uniref:S1 RNA-binding domain-containing protein n=1 Tax=Streptomyces katrae TaxID=68223 RepID=UPI0004C1E502|nr:S1 RNA-binding domain-containing protein [Streptomyces katrae]